MVSLPIRPGMSLAMLSKATTVTAKTKMIELVGPYNLCAHTMGITITVK